jgi:hypothetical protein
VEAPLRLVEEGDAPGGSEVRLLLKSEAGLFFQLLAYTEWKEFVFTTVSLRSSIKRKYTTAGFKLCFKIFIKELSGGLLF